MGADLLKQRSRKSRHSGEMFSGIGGGPLLLAMWNRADTCAAAASCETLVGVIKALDVKPGPCLAKLNQEQCNSTAKHTVCFQAQEFRIQ